MTEHKTLNTVIHAAFRRDLKRFEEALEGDSFGPPARTAQLTAAWDNLSYQLHRHHQDEEMFFWPAFLELGAATSLIDSLDQEHEAMVNALAAADSSMATFASTPTVATVDRARNAITELHRVLHEHLTHEERDLEPFGATHNSSKQHKAAKVAARKAHTEGGGTFFAWLSDGCDRDAARALRREVPAPVLFILTRFAGRRYNQRIAPAWS